MESIHADERQSLAMNWAMGNIQLNNPHWSMVAGDASFRRYFRISDSSGSWIVMDAPPDKEDSQPFLDIAARLRAANIHAPEILQSDLDQGFILLEDLGDDLLRDLLHTNNADEWFDRLLPLLADMAGHVDPTGLPSYDRNKLVEELELFTTWYLQKHKGVTLTCDDWSVWEALCTRLMGSVFEQPIVFVHRDFHSCNLLRLDNDNLGVIDFQDGVRGPLTYDFASLIWDRYIHWPRSRILGWMESFRAQVAAETDPETWVRWCDWMGLQRNIKIVGIFARLYYRDGRDGYVEMIPQFWRYLQDVLPLYEDTQEFLSMLERLKCAP